MESLCPISKGMPTKMTQASFETACARCRQEASKKQGTMSHYTEIRRMWEKMNTFIGRGCRECGGKMPAEIEIISLKEQQDRMALESIRCESCGERQNCKMSNGRMLCSTCSLCLSLAGHHPEIVMQMLLEAQGEDYFVKAQKLLMNRQKKNSGPVAPHRQKTRHRSEQVSASG